MILKNMKVNSEIKVKYTKDYSKFSFLTTNRSLDGKHIQKMIISIRKMGITRPVITTTTNIIEGIKKTYVIDGQHLLSALEREGLEVPYIELDIKDEFDLIDKMAYLNNSSKSWILMDYINAWKMLKPDYMQLFKWHNIYNLEPTMIAAIATLNSNIKHTSAPIKDGTFKITNIKVEKMLEDFSEIFLEIGNVDRGIKFQFLNIFLTASSNYNHKKVLANIHKYLKDIKLLANGEETREFIKKLIFNI